MLVFHLSAGNASDKAALILTLFFAISPRSPSITSGGHLQHQCITAQCREMRQMGQSLLLDFRMKPFHVLKFFIRPEVFNFLLWVMLSAREAVRVSGKRGSKEERDWWSLASLLARPAKRKVGIGKTAGPGMKRRKSEKTFYWCWCWVWQLPLSKNKFPVAVEQDAAMGTCQRQTAEVAAALVKWAWRPQGAGSSMTVTGCGSLQAVYWNRAGVPSPPLWAGSQNNQECRWCIPLKDPGCLREGGEARQRALGTTKGCLARRQETRQSQS